MCACVCASFFFSTKNTWRKVTCFPLLLFVRCINTSLRITQTHALHTKAKAQNEKRKRKNVIHFIFLYSSFFSHIQETVRNARSIVRSFVRSSVVIASFRSQTIKLTKVDVVSTKQNVCIYDSHNSVQCTLQSDAATIEIPVRVSVFRYQEKHVRREYLTTKPNKTKKNKIFSQIQ